VDQNNRVQVGDKLHSFAAFNALPAGTLIGTRRTDRYPFRKRDNGMWYATENNYGDIAAENNFSLGAMVVISYPEGYRPGPPVQITALQWQWQFRDYMFAAQEMHGVSHAVVARAMDDLGFTPDLFPMGPDVLVESRNEQDRLPEGTILVCGDTSDLGRSGVFVRRSGMWASAGLGLLREPRRGYRSVVEAVPGVETTPDWWLAEGTEEDVEAIIDLKRRAYGIAMKAKSSQQWCSTLETCIARVGLTPEVLNQRRLGEYRVGQTVNPEQARRLPVGTVLRWRSQENRETRVQFYIRDNGAVNSARTRRVCGYRDDSVPLTNYARVMEIMAFPETALGLWVHVQIDLVRALPSLEPGTLLSYQSEQPAYMVTQDHHICPLYDVIGQAEGTPPRTGRWDHTSFDNPSQLYVARFGPHVPARPVAQASTLTSEQPF